MRRKPMSELIVHLDNDYDLQRAAMLFTMEKFVATQYGPRCDEVAPDCPCCKMWATYDHVSAYTAE